MSTKQRATLVARLALVNGVALRIDHRDRPLV